MNEFLHTAIDLVTAFLLGGLIGVERQWRQRTAGLRTNVLVALGAAAFVDLGGRVAPTNPQVIAYVVSGIGFLGAGVIMKEGAQVRGLNTAATLWSTAAVGAFAATAGQAPVSVVAATFLARARSPNVWSIAGAGSTPTNWLACVASGSEAAPAPHTTSSTVPPGGSRSSAR